MSTFSKTIHTGSGTVELNYGISVTGNPEHILSFLDLMEHMSYVGTYGARIPGDGATGVYPQLVEDFYSQLRGDFSVNPHGDKKHR